MNKILLITPESGQVIHFRERFISDLQKNGFKVAVLTLDNIHQKEIEKRNIEFYYVDDSNRSVNPFNVLKLKNEYKERIKECNPDIVFTFMLKPNTFGALAAKELGLKNIFSMVEGTGDPFTYNSLKWRLIRLYVSCLYKKSFKYPRVIFFLNKDDRKEFVERKLVDEKKTKLVFGIGVDLDYYKYEPITNLKSFLMIARLLPSKGVFEYCKAARVVKKQYPDAKFVLVGPEGSIKKEDIQEYIDDGSIEYMGGVKDVRPYIKDCTFYVLPSYKEGMPVTVMEAQAMGRPCIVSNTNGCRDTIVEGYNGYLCEKESVESLSNVLLKTLKEDIDVKEMSMNANKFAKENFDVEKIDESLIEQVNG